MINAIKWTCFSHGHAEKSHTGDWTIKMQSRCRVQPYCTCDLHTFSLHNVDIIFRASIVTIQTQGSPEVGPQLAMSSDKGTNYFSVGKQELEWRDRNSDRADKSQWHPTDSQPPNPLNLYVEKAALQHWGEQRVFRMIRSLRSRKQIV